MPNPDDRPPKPAFQFLSAIFRAITKVEETCIAWAMIGVAVLTIGNVVARTLGSSLAFAEELSMFLVIYATFLGLGYGAGKARHIRMTAIYDQLPTLPRRRLMTFITATTAALLFGLTWLSLDYVFGTVRELGSVSPVLRVPLWVVYLAAPIGLGLAGVQYLLAFYRNLTAREGVWLSFDHTDAYDDAPPVAEI